MKGQFVYLPYWLLFLGVILGLIITYAVTKSNSDNVSISPWQMIPEHIIPVTEIREIPNESRDVRALAPSIDLWGSDIYNLDQGIWGSCTAFSGRYAYYLYTKRTGVPVEISAAYVYAKSRQALNLGLNDTGSTNAATANVISKGIVKEVDYPYYAKNIFMSPGTMNTSGGATFRSIPFSSSSATTLMRIQTALQTGPVIAGIRVYNSMMTRAVMVSGIVPIPSAADLKKGTLGGHSICLTGYTGSVFTFRNSWGTSVGNIGNFTIPFNYITNSKYCFDMWTI